MCTLPFTLIRYTRQRVCSVAVILGNARYIIDLYRVSRCGVSVAIRGTYPLYFIKMWCVCVSAWWWWSGVK